MLRSLHVRNYVLIDSLEIDFPEGLVIITGQTGAGKSILLGALGLALGGKADASLVGTHGETCVVEAEFSVGEIPGQARNDEGLRALMAENDLEVGDTLLIRRTLNRTGRSRSFVNDEPVSLPVIPGSTGNLDACRKAWNDLQGIRKELAEVTDRLQRIAAEKDYNEALFLRLEAAKLRDGELEELETEQKQLAHAEELKEYLNNCEDVLAPADDRAPLTAQLKEAEKQAARAARFIPALEPLVQRMESARLELEDIAEELESANARIDVSPDRLEQVEERMSLLYDLMKKHGVQSVGELIAERDRLSEVLFDSTSLEERRMDLEKRLAQAEKAYSATADALHDARQNASEGFANAILASLAFLELDHALFRVELGAAPEGPSGRDAVRFLFSSTGKALQDLSKVASGGELSRIMLSLKAMMARYTAMPALIFDEIDAGVSGSAADRMGQMICRMGEDMQVFAITHLPQVAAKGNAHYLVTKENDITDIRLLTQEDRVQEIARLLSGSVITDAAVANARALLSF